MARSSKSKYSGTFMFWLMSFWGNAAKCQVPWAPTTVNRSWLLVPHRCTWMLIAWDPLKLLAPLNCTGFLLLFLLLTIYLQKRPHQFFQFLEILKWSQFLQCQILQIFCWLLAHCKEFQRLPAILLRELWGVFLTLASKLLKNHAELAEEILRITVQTFWKIFSFPWSRDRSLSLTESMLMIFCFLAGFWKYPVLLRGI